MNDSFNLHIATPVPSPARAKDSLRGTIRVAAIQDRWHGTVTKQIEQLTEAASIAHDAGAQLIAFSELTLYPYLCYDPKGPKGSPYQPETLEAGPTATFAKSIAMTLEMYVVASLYERAEGSNLGFNTAIVISPTGELILSQRKTHLPITSGYSEDKWFLPADSKVAGTVDLLGARLGVPTCWDQWFPELARLYGLQDTDILIYPTAIGSEPNFPLFDTASIWRSTMVGHAISNGLFVIAANRIGVEGPNTFYGTSFIADPYGRILVDARRDERSVLVADLDLDAKRDWLELFPFFETRKPQFYSPIISEEK